MTRQEILSQLKRLEPWFHCVDLGNGLKTKVKSAIGEPVEHPRPTWEKVQACLPTSLSGKSVLDVGCNAGFYAIEMKRRGADRVVGVDSQRYLVRQATFVRDVLGMDIEYRRMSVYDLHPRELGQFDVTLALGLLYHCKHLVLALENLFAVTSKLLIIETAIYPPEKAPRSFSYDVGGLRPVLHPLAYVENSLESKEAVFNWFLPGIESLKALLRNVGFDRIKVFPATEVDRAILACHKREPYADSHAASYLNATLTLASGPARCKRDEVVKYSIRAENRGFARWLKQGDKGTDRGAVRLGAHLLTANDEVFSWYHAGTFLTKEVIPGEVAELEMALRAPATPGTYVIEFDMVAEHVSWFEDQGSRTLRHELTVE